MSTEVIILPCDDPVPQDAAKGRPQVVAIRAALAAMSPGGGAIEVNRGLAAAQHHVYRYRVQNGRDMAFKVRTSKPGWSKIWRVR